MTGSPFGTTLRELRRQQSLSLAGLSELVHYSKAYLSRVETGERPATAQLAQRCDQVLKADGLLAGLADDHPRRARGHRPAQAPAAIADFTGRADAMRELAAAVVAGAGIVVISGPPGVGKTALALHWAHQVTSRFPDGCLFADLQGFGAAELRAEPGDVLDAFLCGLGIHPTSLPPTPDQRSALLRTLLHGRRMLIVLDNAATSAQVRPLLPGTAKCLVVVTSRSRLSGLVARDSAARVTLHPFHGAEALLLLRRILGAETVDAEPRAADSLAWSCGNLPLALLVQQLAADRDRLDLLDTGEDEVADVRSVFSWSYDALPPAQARMFRLLGLCPGADTSLLAAAALAGVTMPQARRLLEALAGVHLIEETGPGRYTFHDLLRLYAAERIASEETAQDRAAAIRRLLGWCLHGADATDRVLMPHRRHIPLEPPGPDCTPMTFTEPGQAIQWLEVERSTLVAAPRLAAQAGDDATAWKLPAALWSFFQLRSLWDDWIATTEIGLAAARRLGDRLGDAVCLNSLGLAHFDLGRLDDALEHFRQALAIYRETGDRHGQATLLNSLGLAYFDLGRLNDALEHFEQVMAIGRELGDTRKEALALANLGETCRALGRFREAIGHTGRSLSFWRGQGEQHSEANVLDNLAEIYRELQQFDDSRACLQQALDIRVLIGDRRGEAETLCHFGELHAATGQTAFARQSWQQALTIFHDLGDPQAAELADRLRGRMTLR